VSGNGGHEVIFDATISAGNLITIVFGAIIWIVTIAIAWSKFGGRMDMLEFRIELMETTLKQIATVLQKFNTSETDIVLLKKEVASLQEDYSALNTTVEGLRRGEGFIQSRRRGNVDGEYARPE
jgi:hypothetical protein